MVSVILAGGTRISNDALTALLERESRVRVAATVLDSDECTRAIAAVPADVIVLQMGREAEQRAKEILRNAGGGEAVIHDRQGQIRDSDTVPPARDPFPPRDTKH